MKIKELFDPNKNIDRRIESVVTFAQHNITELESELNEYVVTDKLHDNYENVLTRIQEGFSDSTNEVGIWVSGFYGSGKSSFAKYLGYSFDSSLIIDSVSFGERLMNRMNDVTVKQLHKAIVSRFSPLVVMIDLSTQQTVGRSSNVSDIIYFETLKALGITSSTDPKIIDFIRLLETEGKMDEFRTLVVAEGKDWNTIQKNSLMANIIARKYAPIVLPDVFATSEEYDKIKVDSVQNEEERLAGLINLIKKTRNNDKVLFVLDEVGQYISGSVPKILNLQGMMQTIKDKFRGNVWVVATAQQTLTEDNPSAQLNSNELFRLNDRFPVKVDIEAEDIKEIITKRLLGKSSAGKKKIQELFDSRENIIKLNTELKGMTRSRYIQVIDRDRFANLYPFLPVHVDILLALLQKLASRTGGVGLRSVIRLIRDILIDNHLAEADVNTLACPDHFFDVLRPDLEKNRDYKEIVTAAQGAMDIFRGDTLAIRICKAIAVMQILDDFKLSVENLVALLYSDVAHDHNAEAIRTKIEDIKSSQSITLEEVDGELRFMTNAILSVKEERNNKGASELEKTDILKSLVEDIFTPQPTVQIGGNKALKIGVDLFANRRSRNIQPGDNVKLEVRFIESSDYEQVHNDLTTQSTLQSNNRVVYMVNTLPASIDRLLTDIVKDEYVIRNHASDSNKEVADYIKSQQEDSKAKKQEVLRLLREAFNNSELIFRGSATALENFGKLNSALRNYAEKVFYKYNIAPKSAQSSWVKDLARYEDFSTVPASLNPFGIIKEDGSIDIECAPFRELMDYINTTENITGASLMTKFDEVPYGWSKDTTRYLVALMLKGGLVNLRVNAQEMKILSVKAAAEIENNNKFSRVGVIKNTDAKILPAELMKVRTILTELFNPRSLSPTKDALAKAAFKAMSTSFKSTAERYLQIFTEYHIAGADKIQAALHFAQKIISTEGADAPYLFAKEPECEESMRYVLQIDKCESHSQVITHIRQIHQLLTKINSLTPIPELAEFRNEIDQVKVSYNSLLEEDDIVDNSISFSTLYDKIKNLIKTALETFALTFNQRVDADIDAVKNTYNYAVLKDQQKDSINAKLARLHISDGETFDDLKTAVDEYSLYFNPGAGIAKVKSDIDALYLENKRVSEAHDSGTGGENSIETDHDNDSDTDTPQTPTNNVKSVKRKMARHELQSLISDLQSLLDTMNDIDTIELNFDNQ